MASFITKRDGYWYLVRRVPKSVAEYDGRGLVRQTTGIRVADDPRGVRGQRAVDQINGELEIYWRSLINGRSEDAARRYEAARARARSFGFTYEQANVLTTRLPELAERLDALDAAPGGADDEAAVAALLGGVSPPPILLSKLVETYQQSVQSGLSDLSAEQLRRWQSPKKRAVANLIALVGDKAIGDLTRSDALDFRDWWAGRVAESDMDPDTANKDIGALNKMWRDLNKLQRLGLESIFSEIRLEKGRSGQRVAYDPSFIQTMILREGMFEGLNDEARRIIYLVTETGLRLSEAANLTADTIQLNCDVPHVQVRPDGRRMKTDDSERDIPLVGVALIAMRQQPSGFPRYRDKAPSLSALVNKALSARQLRPQPGQSLYSLRHSFEDRLTAVEAPEKIIAVLMGHKHNRPKYGLGPSLEQKQKWLQRIAFSPPATV